MSRTTRLAALLLAVPAVLASLLVVAAPALAADADHPPSWCFRGDAAGNPATCTWDGTSWHRSYADTSPGGGAGGGFAALFVLVLLGGIAFTIWKVSTARRMARDSGMDTGDATAMTLLTDDGFEATYLASSLRGHTAPVAPAGAASEASAGERLRRLAELRDQGLITEAEHDEKRARILDEL